MKPELGKLNPSDTGMCPHGNFVDSCATCAEGQENAVNGENESVFLPELLKQHDIRGAVSEIANKFSAKEAAEIIGQATFGKLANQKRQVSHKIEMIEEWNLGDDKERNREVLPMYKLVDRFEEAASVESEIARLENELKKAQRALELNQNGTKERIDNVQGQIDQQTENLTKLESDINSEISKIDFSIMPEDRLREAIESFFSKSKLEYQD